MHPHEYYEQERFKQVKAKYDMIAIPDFSSGAMENWGLVLYRETCILVDPANSSQSSKQWVAIVVCHETAHQVPNRNG